MTGPATPPRLVVRVGVTGHRPSGLSGVDMQVLGERVRHVLTSIADAAVALGQQRLGGYAGDPPLLRLVSPIAEGADRLVVEPALELGYELQCVLPFERDSYEKDFISDRSRAEFHDLLARATAVLELDGSYEPGPKRESAYERAGRVTLHQCDVLLAIWNGQPSAGRGGTAQIVAEALEHEIPVAWVDTSLPHAIRALIEPEDSPDRCVALDDLTARLRSILLAGADADDRLKGPFYGVNRPPLWFRPRIFQRFRSLLTVAGDRAKGHESLGSSRSASAARADTQRRAGKRDGGREDSLDVAIPAPPPADLEWADKLAEYYGDLYRSSFVANYLLAALAVLFALLGFRHHWAVVVELLLIVLIITNTAVGHRNDWHWRWLNYRLLAEQLRQFRLVWPLGHATPSSRVPAHSADADPANLWISWLFRARVREAGLVQARLDRNYVDACHRAIVDGIEAQVAYHNAAAHGAHLLHHRLHSTAIGLFAATAVACMLHLTPLGHEAGWNDALTLLAAFLPACGAALAGITSHGEFSRVARRSEAMQQELQALAARVQSIQSPSSELTGRVAEEAARIMVDELVDWQVIFRGKPLTLPA